MFRLRCLDLDCDQPISEISFNPVFETVWGCAELFCQDLAAIRCGACGKVSVLRTQEVELALTCIDPPLGRGNLVVTRPPQGERIPPPDNYWSQGL